MSKEPNPETVSGEVLGSESVGVQEEFQRLLDMMDTLRRPGGCAWTGAQTHQSIMHYFIEETYEVVEAVEGSQGVDFALLREELGDVLLNVIFHARMASEVPIEQGGFSIHDVMTGLAEKIVRRNPHIFGGGSGSDLSAQEIFEAWDQLKEVEKPERTGLLDGIPPHLPALALAEKALAKAAKAGLLQEQEEIGACLPVGLENEDDLGAYLFGLVAGARMAGFDAERALRNYTRSYIQQHSE